MTDDLPKDVTRALLFSAALTEIGLGEGHVLPDTILNEAITHILGADPSRQSAFRRTLIGLEIFEVTPEETRGAGRNYYIHRGIPDNYADALPQDAQPQPPEEAPL